MAETAGGALLTLGALTPLATSLISGTMITAIRTAHAGKGPWVTGCGWEYPLVIGAAMVALAEAGPGRPSVDSKAFPRLKGPAGRWRSSPFEHPRRFVRETEREPVGG